MDDADERDDGQVGAADQQRQQRADASRGQGGKNRDRVNVAFVQHAEDDVNGKQGGENQQRFAFERLLKSLGRAGKGPVHVGWHADVVFGILHGGHRIA